MFFPASTTFFFYFAHNGCNFGVLQAKNDDMKKKVVFILMAAVTMLTDCQNKGGEDMAEEKSFETMTVSKQDITLSQSYPASVEGRQSVKIIPRVEGICAR